MVKPASPEAIQAAKNVVRAQVIDEPAHQPVPGVEVYKTSNRSGNIKYSWRFMLDDEVQFDGHEQKDTFEDAEAHAMKMCGTSWNIIIKRVDK